MANEVHGRFGARSPADGGEEVLEVDAGCDDEGGGEDGLQIGSSVIVVERVVRGEEGATIEEAALRENSPTKDDARIGRMAELGPRLADIDGARLHMRDRLRWGRKLLGAEAYDADKLGGALECVLAA